jgi:hypothetical protein
VQEPVTLNVFDCPLTANDLTPVEIGKLSVDVTGPAAAGELSPPPPPPPHAVRAAANIAIKKFFVLNIFNLVKGV